MRNAVTLKLNQYQTVPALAERFGITKPSVIPSAAGGKPLSKANVPQTRADAGEMCRIPYQGGVGALMWVAIMTRGSCTQSTFDLESNILYKTLDVKVFEKQARFGLSCPWKLEWGE